jgi:MoxR-like ATPase
MVVRGLVDKPIRIDTPLGTLADAGRYLTPKLSRRVLHQVYLGYPDSAAARGAAVAPEPATQAPQPARRPKPPTRTVRGLRVPRPVKTVVRRVPGVHW